MPFAKPARGVDCHAHVFSSHAPAVPGARYRPGYAATLDAWSSHWGACGITRGVLVQPSFFGTDNREMLAAIASRRDALRGVAVVDAAIDDAALALLDAGGVRAIRLNLHSVADYAGFGDRSWTSLYRRIEALGWHVEVFVEPGRVPELAGIFDGSAVAVVLDHFANPGADAAAIEATFRFVAAMNRERQMWVKLSGPYRLAAGDPGELARRWIETLGGDRLVWGSDWPWTRHEAHNHYGRLRRELDAWVGAECSRAILWDNAAHLYRFD